MLARIPLSYWLISMFGFIGNALAIAAADCTALLALLAYIRCFKPKTFSNMLEGFDADLVFQWNGFMALFQAIGPGMLAGLLNKTAYKIGFLLLCFRVLDIWVDPITTVAMSALVFGVVGII